ncbi:phosphotransferase family protein [Microbacterium ureisolvens]|uniref:phosphotransferase family protein n=1 Tax=Microbacterium ureisolvens TaxID=2781186 RepID=UPI003627753C
MILAVTPEESALLSELGRRHGLWSRADVPGLVSRGTENVTFAVGDYMVRRSEDLEAVVREVEVLAGLATATSVPTPTPAFHEPALGLFAYRRLDGTPLLSTAQPPPRDLERAVIDALAALRRLDASTRLPLDHYPNARWHDDAVQAFRAVREHLTADQRRLVQAFLDEPPPATRPDVVAQHNDLGAEHILVGDDGEVTGIIDWTDAALADPARDIGSIYRDLGPDTAFRIGAALNGPVGADEARRIRFHARCRWLEDVAFGVAEPPRGAAYLANAWSTFGHTFAGG